MKINKIVAFIFLLLISILLFGRNINAASNSFSNLEFKLSKVIEIGSIKVITVDATNNYKSTKYSFGWGKSCDLIVETTKGTYKHNISSKIINKGTKKYTYVLKAPGEIQSIRYSEILKLDSNDLPPAEWMITGLGYASYDVNVSIGDYYFQNAIPLIISSAILLIALIIIIILIGRSKIAYIFYRTVGITFMVIGIGILLFSCYLFVIRPILKQADLLETIKKYWYLWVIGLIMVPAGNSIRQKKGKKRSKKIKKSSYIDQLYLKNKLISDNKRKIGSNYKNNYSNNSSNSNNVNNGFIEVERQKQIAEQNRLFQDQAQRDAQQAMDQAQFDSQQNLDQMNQQSFNDFNDFNNFNNFM